MGDSLSDDFEIESVPADPRTSFLTPDQEDDIVDTIPSAEDLAGLPSKKRRLEELKAKKKRLRKVIFFARQLISMYFNTLLLGHFN